MTDDSSDLSSIGSLSPAPSDSEPEVTETAPKKKGLLKFFKKAPKPTNSRAKKEPSPPHEFVFADNPDIAFIVMFRARFNDVFSLHLATFGPQELENDVTDFFSGNRVEAFLCALLALILNRKQDVKPGHYGRALEEAISTHKSQWPKSWEGKSPLSGSATFESLAPSEKLALLRGMIHWALTSSEAIRSLIAKSYKNRADEDRAIPISVQPWGSDSDKRRYFLIEGRDGTSFRIYRESNPQGFNRTWWSVADSIDSLKDLANRLEEKDGGPKAKNLAHSMRMAVPRLEESEEKRRRREYRLKTKERFTRPELGQSLYEGRTRGKRVKYTFDEDEDITEISTRRSTRNTRNQSPLYNEAAPPPTHSRSTRSTRQNPDVFMSGTNRISRESREESVSVSGRPQRDSAKIGSKRKSSEPYFDNEDLSEPEPDIDNDGDDHVPTPESDQDDDEFSADDEMADDDEEVINQVVEKMKSRSTRDKANAGGMLSPTDGNEDNATDKAGRTATPAMGSLETPDDSPSGRKSTPDREVPKTKITLKSPAAKAKALAYRASPDKPYAIPIAADAE